MNYRQIESLTYDRQATLLAEAEQRRLAKRAITRQLHPMRAWVAQRLLTWGQWLTSGKARSAISLTAEHVAR
ncbi:MAG: hypothetical protein DYG89_36105 [Caldilinea sp. CFX5]|nr:hypothetical protein [Caldilinea sp. CFX5]